MDASILRIDFMQQGGILMWPILFCSMIGLGISIERFIALRRATLGTRELLDALRQMLRQGRVQEALEMAENTPAVVARVIRAGLLKHSRRKSDIREAMEDAGSLEAPRLERYLSALATCATVAPMLGLLGTVQGMIMAFAEIQNQRGQVNPSELAEGIGTALYTTAFGLAVAIPLLVLYNYFVARVEQMVVEMEVQASEMVELLTRDRDDEDD